jgi:hypothetical protein
MANNLAININRIQDTEMKEFPYFWMISDGTCNFGHGWSATKKQAVKDAHNYYMATHKWED